MQICFILSQIVIYRAYKVTLAKYFYPNFLVQVGPE